MVVPSLVLAVDRLSFISYLRKFGYKKIRGQVLNCHRITKAYSFGTYPQFSVPNLAILFVAEGVGGVGSGGFDGLVADSQECD